MSVTPFTSNILPPGCMVFTPRSSCPPHGVGKRVVFSHGVTKDIMKGMVFPLNRTTKGKLAYQSMLFYGPPGTGKSLAAKYGAQVSADAGLSANVFYTEIHGSQLLDCNATQGFSWIQKTFSLLRLKKPAVCFLDRADEFLKGGSDVNDISRLALKQQLISEMDKRDENEQICFVAAVNNVRDLDKEILRRFDVKSYFALPDYFARYTLLTSEVNLLQDVNVKDLLIKNLVESTEGFSGFDVITLIKTVYNDKIFDKYMERGGELSEPVTVALTMEDFHRALLIVKPINTPEDVELSRDQKLEKRLDFNEFFKFVY